MHQSTTPSLSPTIWPWWPWIQFPGLPIVHTLLPVTFAYSISSEAVVTRQLRRWKRLWRHTYTRGLSWSLPEVVGMVEQVHCSRRRLLRRGLKFHVCTIYKSAHTKKIRKPIVWTSNLCNTKRSVNPLVPLKQSLSIIIFMLLFIKEWRILISI